jgi:hypothetical protein
MQLWVEFVDLYHFRKREQQSSSEQGIAGSMLAHPLRRGRTEGWGTLFLGSVRESRTKARAPGFPSLIRSDSRRSWRSPSQSGYRLFRRFQD